MKGFDNLAALTHLLGTADKLSDYRQICAAVYLLASEESAAKDVVRSLAPGILAKPCFAEKGFWQNIDFWLDRSPVERCLAHVKTYQNIDALALLTPLDTEVEEVFDALLSMVGLQPFGLFTLAAIWLLEQADPSTSRRLLSRITPSLWIEHVEYEALATRLGISATSEFQGVCRPSWVPRLHPAIARDPLGGALTRAALLADSVDVLGQNWKKQTPGDWVIYGDLDNLRVLNDALGFLAADLAICGTIQTLQQAVGDTVIRFGGEEFVMFHDGSSGAELAERLRELVEKATYAPIGHLDEAVNVTISFGVARGGNLQDSMRAAEDALHKAKLKGRNCVVVAD